MSAPDDRKEPPGPPTSSIVDVATSHSSSYGHDDDAFLSQLRAAMGDVQDNEATLPTANRAETQPQPSYPSLTDLFVAPPTTGSVASPISNNPSTSKPPIAPPPPPPNSAVLPPPRRSTSPIPPMQPANLPKPLLARAQTADPTAPTAASAPAHKRNVSWGVETRQLSPLQQPSLNSIDEKKVARPLEEVLPIPASASAHQRHQKQQRRIQLEDVLRTGPFELEAETHILRAIDRQAAAVHRHERHRSRADTMTSSILSSADDAQHDFDLDFDEDEGHSSLETKSLLDEGSVRMAGMEVVSEDKSLHLDEEQASPKKSLEDSAGSMSQQSRPLLGQKKPSQRQLNLHRRSLSVENTLSGLASAMQAIHQTDEDETGDRSLAVDDAIKGSADQFAHNTVLLDKIEKSNLSKSPIVHNRGNYVDELPVLQEESGDDEDDDADGENGSKKAPSAEQRAEITDESGRRQQFAQTGRPSTNQRYRRRAMRRSSVIASKASQAIQDDWSRWKTFYRSKKKPAWKFSKTVLVYFMIPATLIAAILFYFGGNPPTGSNNTLGKASASWWLLFLCRQVVTLSFALVTQAVVIDFLALETRILLRLVGPVITLLLVQSKGWPFITAWWAIYSFAMLEGESAFVAHWLYWQNPIGLFNEQNPSGEVVSNPWNRSILSVAIGLSAVTAVKRFVIGLYLGRKTFIHHGAQLAKVMKNMLLVSEVAKLAKQIEKRADAGLEWSEIGLRGLAFATDDDDDFVSVARSRRSGAESERLMVDPDTKDPVTGDLSASDTFALHQLLEEWEEPDVDRHEDQTASISAVLNFRKALVFIQKRYPFSFAFGEASSREECVESAQDVYFRLLRRRPDEELLPFETLALLTLDEDGKVDQDKAKALIRLFRPDRQGNLTLLDFVKSIDAVYKSYRLLSATISNSSQIDAKFEQIFNAIYYTVAMAVIIAALGYDPLAIFLSLSSVILALSFMIGRASANYFEGLMFILVRRPYSIGDRIHVSNVEQDTSLDGCKGWVVENITLYETTAIWTPTKERCSLANGSLASSRIINGARSPQAQFHIFLKFPIATEFDKILIFKSAIEEYLKARPREWLSLNGFRANKLFADRGFVEYAVVAQHRESWQEIGQLLDSKANLSSYCQEVARQLKMHYTAPPLPVDLRYSGDHEIKLSHDDNKEEPHESDYSDSEQDTIARTDRFRSLALTKHNIRFS